MRWVYLFFLILLALSTWIHTVNAAVVDIPDPVLEEKLRSALSLGVDADITDTALESLTVLSTTSLGETDPRIADLTGLEFAINLTGVNLIGHNISDLQPLTTWTSIKKLNLGGNSIVDLGPLKNLDTLTALYLDNNQIVDVSPLAGLTNLTGLTLGGNDDLVDTSPLAWLPLTSVDVNIPPAVRINDVPTSEQSGAFNVTIEFSEVVIGFEAGDIDLTGTVPARVDSLTQDQQNTLKYTATIIPASGAVGKVIIQVLADAAVDDAGNGNTASDEYTVFVDVAPVDAVDVPDDVLASKLRAALGLANNAAITDTALAGLTGKLNLDGSPSAGDEIVNLTGLNYVTGINSLSLGAHSISNLTPLAGLMNLTSLALNSNSISDLTPLEDLTNLTSLTLSNNSISNLTPLSSLTNLTTLTIISNSIEDLTPLVSLTNLTILEISRNSIKDLTPLASLTNLTRLSCSSNSVSDLTPLANLVKLQILEMLANPGLVNADYSHISWLPELTIYSGITKPLAVRIDVPDGTQNAPFEVTITFSSADVSDFTEDDITLAGNATATVTDLAVDSPLVEGVWAVYTATITPTTDGDITIQVPAGVAQDNDGRNNNDGRTNEASSEDTVSVDVAPQVTEIRWPADFGDELEYHTSPTDIIPDVFPDVLVDIIFSEDVTIFEPDDIELLGTATTAEIKSVNQGDSDAEYTLTISITPTTDGTGDGTLGIDIPAGIVQDVSGGNNGNIEYSTGDNAATILFAPTLEIVVPKEPQNGAFDVMFKFNEPVMDNELVTGLTRQWVESYFTDNSVMADIGGTLSAWAENGDGTIYTATITPTRDGDFPIFEFEEEGIPAVNTDGIQVLDSVTSPRTVTVDLPGPSVTITTEEDLPEIVNGRFDVTITFSEEVTGFTAVDIDLTEGDADATVTSFNGSGREYTAEITPEPESDGEVIIQVPENAANGGGGGNTPSNTYTVSVDLVRPSVVISDVPTTANAPFEVTITFSEDVTGFAAGDISLTGSATAEVTGSGSDYTAEITPTTDGEVTIQVPADVAVDSVDNGNTASQSHTVSVDLSRPSVVISDVPTTANAPFEVTITFSEDVTGFAAGDISLTGSATAEVTGSGSDYTAEITPTTDGEVTIQVPADVAVDSVDNGNTASQSHTVSVDLVRPSVVISDVPTTSQNSDFDITITFSESVTGFQASDISLTGTATATVTDLIGSGTTYTASITPTGSGDLTIRVRANVAQDDVSNNNTASGEHTVSVDLVRPSVSITGVPTTPQNGAFDITITFSESVTGFQASGISLTGTATATVTDLIGSGTTYTASITPTGSGDLTIRVRANVAQDDVSNNNTASGEHTVSVDLVRPSVSITGVPTTPQNGAFDITITFSESVTGFQASGISLTGTATAAATVTDLIGSGTTYTASITPTGSGDLTIRVRANVAEDGVGNGNTASQSYTVPVDVDRPTVRLSNLPTTPQNSEFAITITFNESVSDFVLGDISLTGTATAAARVSAFSGSGTTYTASITPTGSGNLTIQVPANVAVDTAGNGNTESDPYTVEVDLVPPTVRLSNLPTAPQNSEFAITIEFSEAVTGFDENDISLTFTESATAEVSDFTVSGSDYTATITPATGAGNLTIQVPANVAEDGVGNGNTESDRYTVKVDVDRPMVTITSPSGPYNAPFDVTISFSEAVTGFDENDISLTFTESATAEVSDFTVSGSDYTATITPATGTVGDVMISVPADAAFDDAGNGNAESDPYTVEVDLVSPTVRLSNLPTAPQNSAFAITIEFSEAVTGFDENNISLTFTESATAEVSDFTVSGSDYTAEITPTGSGNLTIQVPANVAVDAATNWNTASTTHTISIDVDRPTVTLSNVPTVPQNGAFTITITFNEVVKGFVWSDISLGSPASATVVLDGSGPSYTATITPGDAAVGNVEFHIPENVAEDGVGNGNTASQSYTVPVDLVSPTVRLSNLPMLPQTGEFAITITFDEDVTGFVWSDISLRGTASATVVLDGSGPSYTATITPTGGVEGDIIIQVPADVAHDIADNDNTASPEYTVAVSAAWMPDKNLRDIVRDVLLLPVDAIFTKEELLGLTELGAAEVVPFSDDLRITDLTGLEYATNLTKLSLNEHAISDLRPLATLTQLTKLSLNDNLIESIWHEDSDDNPFENLTELTELSLDDNLIDDLSPLESLPQLTKLSLNDNVIEDISALEALAELTELSLNLNLIDDITALVGLTQLTTLSLNENEKSIDDLMPLQGLTELTELSLNDNSIEDISFCAALTQLKILCLENNEISDVSPLVGLPNLELLKLSGNPIHDPASLIGIARRIEADALIGSLVPDEALAGILRDIFDLDRAEEYVTFADLRSLTTFEVPDSDITDLSGLEHATDLNTLDLRGNTIADITPLKALTKLTTLDLGFNSITDVTPLAGLVKLETLRLTGNPIVDVSPLVDLTADIEADIVVPGVIADAALATAILDSLGLPASTRIKAVTLQNLKNLDVEVDQIETLTGLERATNLTTLIINGGSITDLTPLQTLTQLTTLAINSGAITDLTPLQTLTQLTTLAINGGAITDLTPLQTLTQLTILELRDNTITDITALSELTALTTLDLSGNNINSIEALKVLTDLTTLNLSGNSISSSSINRLQELTKLTTLNLSGNSISSIEALKVLTRLTTLEFADNSLSSIDGLQALTRLTTLNLSGNSISSIEALQVLTRLTTLELADNSLSSIDGLQVLTRLTTLNLSTNDLSDIRPLQGLTALRQLFLASNNISDVSSLAGLVNLEFLRLAGNPIMDTSPLFLLVTTYKLMDVDIEISQWAPWDVNQDGIVNVMDATLVTAAIGQTGGTIANSLTDVNDDGVVDRNDLLLVQEHLNSDAAGAPSTDTIVALLGLDTLKSLSRTSLEAEMNSLIAETDGSLKYQRAIQFLENFLLALRPNKTRLLANYPNPFNPETWIPYTLATVSAVQITIYDVRGAVVRRLDLGHQREGYYTSRSRAAYWDGRNHVGERVASGIYFYELEADDISRLRKMVILK